MQHGAVIQCVYTYHANTITHVYSYSYNYSYSYSYNHSYNHSYSYNHTTAIYLRSRNMDREALVSRITLNRFRVFARSASMYRQKSRRISNSCSGT